MIATRYRPAFAALFGWYTRGLFRRRFEGVWVRGNLPADDAPRLVVVQHVAWWDPMLIFHLSRAHLPRARHYVMMDEANLARLTFFRWIGAYGVDRATPAGALAGLRYSLDRLREPRARVWLFPQGTLRPMDARPIECEQGASWLAARSGAPVVPIALRYEFGEDERPHAFASIGAERPAPARPRGGPDAIAAALTDEADRLRADVHGGRLEGFARAGGRANGAPWRVRAAGLAPPAESARLSAARERGAP